ncbi:MAG: hypothetical protein K8S55_04755, partial [Phycisphaerae bacterium]|nr:hypothetical protein [Phycisphaerae bacterium]
RQLATQAGSDGCLLLPSLQRFKLAMRFDFNQPAAVASDDNSFPPQNPCEAGARCDKTPATFNVTERYRRAIAALQTDLPAQADPFAVIAAPASLSVDDLLVAAADMLSAGVMRRYGAVLHHRAAGARANAMVVWNIPPAKADLAGAAAARYSAVSHCYLRRVADDWPYNLYTMIHSPDRQHCQQTIDRIAVNIGNPPHKTLWTEKEFKKTRVKLFTPDIP